MFKLIWNRIYGSTPAVFESAYDLEESVRRLKAAAEDPAWSAEIIKQVMYGRISEKQVNLRRFSAENADFDDSLFRNTNPRFNLEPYFYGSFQQTDQGVILVGKFTMSFHEKIGIPTICTLAPIIFCSLWFKLVHYNWWSILITLVFFIFYFYSMFCRINQPSEDIPWLTNKISEALSAPE